MPHKIPTRKIPISVKKNPMVVERDKSHYDIKIYQWDFMPGMDQIIYLHEGKAHFAEIGDVTIYEPDFGPNKKLNPLPTKATFLLDFMITWARVHVNLLDFIAGDD